MGLKKKVSIVREYTDIGKKGICCRPLLSRCTASQDDSAACKRWLQWAQRGQTRVSSSLSSCCRVFWVTSQSLPRWCKGLRASLQDHLRRIHRLLSFGGFPSPPGRWRRGGLRGAWCLWSVAMSLPYVFKFTKPNIQEVLNNCLENESNLLTGKFSIMLLS